MAKDPAPMDPSAREDSIGHVSTNRPRLCYAAQTLLDEVNAAYDGAIEFEMSNFNRYNVALDISFDCSDEPTLAWMLLQINDPRVLLINEEEGQVIVTFRENFRTQDRRDPFGLTDAALLLDEEDPS